MLKNKKIRDLNKAMKNNIYTPMTPRTKKQNLKAITDFRKNIKYSSEYYNSENSPKKNTESSIANYNLETKKSPTDILSLLLKNTLGKSLIKLESKTKEHMNTLKSVYKNFMLFDKNINIIKSGLAKKKKKDEKKLSTTKKIKNSKTSKTPLRLRSKTYQNFHYPKRGDNIKNGTNKISTSRLKAKSDKKNIGNLSKNNDGINSSSQNSSNYGFKSKTSRESISNFQKIGKPPKTPKRSGIDKSTNYKSVNRLYGVSSKNNMALNRERKNGIKNIYNTTNTSMNTSSRTIKRKKSIKLKEKPLERRKSLKGVKKDEKAIKRKMSIEKKIKIDGSIKIRKSISNANTQENAETPGLKDIEKNISNFNFNDINIINHNINILNSDNLQKSVISLKDNSDINLITNENININEIINEKNSIEVKDEEKKNEPELHKIRSTIEELEDINEKKPKFLEYRNNLSLRKRMRSYSKNRDRKNFDSISIDKDFEGSLNDVKLMIEGVSGVINKIKITNVKSKFRRKLINDDLFDKENNNGKKSKIKKNSREKNKIMNISNEEREDKNKLLNELDKEITELIEAEEKRKKINKNCDNDNNDDIINKDKNNENNAINKEDDSKIIQNNEKIEENQNEINNGKNRVIQEEIESKNNDEDDSNLPSIKNIKYEKEKQIMNESIINRINSDKNILSNDLNENIKENIYNENIEKENNENKNKKNDKEEKITINDDIKINNKKINNIQVKENISNEEENIQKKYNYLNIIDKNKLYCVDEQTDIIQNESRIMRDEQLIDVINQSLNQSSIMNLSLLEHYILITKDPNIPFSIDNTLKYEKIKCLGILDFLNFQEKMEFTGIHRGFNIERISLLNNKREDFIKHLELSNRETINDLIMKIRLKYSNEELSKKFTKFQVSRGPSKAVELLNNELYSKIFKKNHIEKNEEEISIIYRVLFVLFGEYEIANISNNRLFWIKCIKYLKENSNGKIGSFILDNINNITFEHKKIFFLNKLLLGMKKKIVPNYFSKICGTTGLLVFLIKDTLEYCGVIQNDKKTQPARILDNLLYYKNCIDTIASFIDYLSGIKTYKIRDKKEMK